MSKSTKIIAALGVVAGLGVAALPMASYAATAGQTISGNVAVGASVNDAIAMTITGNNDNGSKKALTADQLKAYINHELQDGEEFKLSSVDVYNPVGATTIGNWSKGTDSIANYDLKVSSSWASLLPNAVVHGGYTTGYEDFKSTITVYTNANEGYKLTVKDADDTLALTQIVSSGTPATINAGTGVAAGTSAWGYTKTAETSTTPAVYTAITASDADVASLNTATPDAGDKTEIFYGVSTSAAQKTGDYYDVITYTATAQN